MKKWGLWGLFVLILSITVYGASFWHYQRLHKQVLWRTKAQLEAFGIELLCSSHPSFLGLKQRDECELKHRSTKLVLWQEVWVLPFVFHGRFGLSQESGLGAWLGQLSPDYFQQESGVWQASLLSQSLSLSYQTGAFAGSLPSETELSFAPAKLNARFSLKPPLDGVFELHLQKLKLDQLGRKLSLSGLALTFATNSGEEGLFIPKSRLSFDKLRLNNLGERLSLSGVKNAQVNLNEAGKLASLNQFSVDSLHLATSSQDLHMDLSQGRIFLSQLDGKLLSLLRQGRWYAAKERLLKSGLSLSVEDLTTSLTYQDREPELFALSGDIRAKLIFSLHPANSEFLRKNPHLRAQSELWLDMSQSLLQGPHSELMMDFVQASWLKKKAGRIATHLWLENGVLLANGQLVSSRAFWPHFQEDH